MLSVMGAVAEFERALLLERQREGVAIAKGKGVYKGRTREPTPTPTPPRPVAAPPPRLAPRTATAPGVSRATVYNTRERVVAQPWTEDHVIAVDDLFRQYGKLTAHDDEVKALAEQLGRTPTAVSARMRNLQAAHAEPGAYPGTGWHFTKMDRRVADRELGDR